MLKTLLVCCTLTAALAVTPRICASSATPDAGRVKLVFSLEQGFANGVIPVDDRVSLTRIIGALKPLQARYDVYLLVNPQVKDKTRLNRALEIMAARHMPFVFDVYSSDSYTLGANCTACEPYDASHCLSISVEGLKAYKLRYGKWLAGIRFMEVFGQDFTVRAIKTTNPEWARPGDKLPKDRVFQAKVAEGFIGFAKEHEMFLAVSDFHWRAFAAWDKEQATNEEQLAGLLRKYRGVVTVVYDNNEPNEDSMKRLESWHAGMEPFLKHGAAGIGLSDQSWLRNDHMRCPPEDIITWADDALNHGCRYIQFEPVWYFFNLPLGSFTDAPYASDPRWTERGEPTPAFRRLAGYLLQTQSAR